jgi:hypothetical protein
MNYKDLIFTAIREQLESTTPKIEKIILIYELNKPTVVYCTNVRKEKVALSLTSTEETTIKIMLFNKIIKQAKKELPEHDHKRIILQIDTINEEIEFFTDVNNKLIQL